MTKPVRLTRQEVEMVTRVANAQGTSVPAALHVYAKSRASQVSRPPDEPTPTQKLMRDALAHIEQSRGKLDLGVARSTIRDYAERREQEGAMSMGIANELVDFGFPESEVFGVLSGRTSVEPTLTVGPSAAQTAAANALATERGGTAEEYATEAEMLDRLMAPERYEQHIDLNPRAKDVDYDTGGMKTAQTTRYATGVVSWRGIYGSNGT